MKIYTLTCMQFLPLSLDEAWDFFSKAKNLSKITPAKMGLNIISISGGDKTYPGQIIHYKISVLPGFKVNWTTEITHVHEPFYFVDEQRFGPFSLWHHQHHFKPVQGGVEMTDEVTYAIPLGLLGRLANWVFVKREVNSIFGHRFTVLEKYFSKEKSGIQKSA